MMADLKKTSVKSKAEAVLFSTGHRISLDNVSKLCRSRKEEVLIALKELQKEYDEKQSSLMLVEEGDLWKFTVRDHLIPIIRKIVTETELTRSVMETLAVIAFKYPILQSDLIKIRTNKAYDHLVELEKSGYISRQKHGRTNLIKLTEKFFRYFDLTEENLREQFKDFDSIAKAIKEKEIEVDKIKEDQKTKAEELRQQDEKIKKEIETLDESGEDFKIPLEAYESKQSEGISKDFVSDGSLIVEKEKIGSLEIIDEIQKPKPAKEKQEENAVEFKAEPMKVDIAPPEITEKDEAGASEQQPAQINDSLEKPSTQDIQKAPRRRKKSLGIKLTQDMESKVDEKVNEMLGVQDSYKKKDNETQPNQNQ